MKITASEIYRLQNIVDNCKKIIILADKKQRENFTYEEMEEVWNMLENTTQEFYLITEQITKGKTNA